LEKLNFSSANDLTLDSTAANERFPLAFRNVNLNFSSTGRIVFAGSGYLRMADGDVLGSTDEKFRFGGDDTLAVFERVYHDAITGNLFGFDDALVSGKFEGWFSSCVFKRSSDIIECDTTSGGVNAELHFVNRTMAPFVSLSATGQTIDVHMDGTSLYYKITTSGTINVHGTGYVDVGMLERYADLSGETPSANTLNRRKQYAPWTKSSNSHF